MRQGGVIKMTCGQADISLGNQLLRGARCPRTSFIDCNRRTKGARRTFWRGRELWPYRGSYRSLFLFVLGENLPRHLPEVDKILDKFLDKILFLLLTFSPPQSISPLSVYYPSWISPLTDLSVSPRPSLKMSMMSTMSTISTEIRSTTGCGQAALSCN